MVLLSQLVLISSILTPEQAQPASNLGSTVSYYDVEKATFDGSPDFSAPENSWREIRTSVFLVFDSNDVEPNSKGDRNFEFSELNFYTKPFKSDSHALTNESYSHFKHLKKAYDDDRPLTVHPAWRAHQSNTQLGIRTMYFIKIFTFVRVEKRLVGKEVVTRQSGAKATGVINVGMRDHQWYDPSVSGNSDPRIDSRIIAEPKWKRATAEELQNFLWESPF